MPSSTPSSLTKHLFAFLLIAACAPTAARAQTTDSGVDGHPSVHSEQTWATHEHVHIGSQHISVPSTHAGVRGFRVRMPWGGHIVVPGVHVRSPRVAVNSPRIDFQVPFSHHKAAAHRQSH
ncbi:MAG TPA: hypothetical protein VME66_02120 [Candidatus Acidoferrales bacterium]|nr:hypothetical protein [Candidatus Acidoferrales bacterium]